jgi:copper(I)-binding protein/putative intracellular protease/amidase
MKRIVGSTQLIIMLTLLICSPAFAMATGAGLAGQGAEKKGYVCPPCGCGSDNQVHEKAGYCPVCAMPLIEQGSQAAQPASAPPIVERKRVAILIFDGVQIIDYTGPYEVFGQAGFEVFTVAASPNTITTSMGMKVTPSFRLNDGPKPDVLVIPGGGVIQTQNDPNVIKWIQETSRDAQVVLSVCNGAFILAKTGLLDGLTATTFYGLLDGFTALASKTKVVSDKRFVDNGKIITTAGLSSGIDGSLHVVSKMLGKARAQMVALNMEYNWQPDANYARASLADIHLRKLFSTALRLGAPAGATTTALSTEGNSSVWEVRWQVRGETTAQEIIKLLDNRLASEGKWVRQDARTASATESLWKFSDERGTAWSGVATVQPEAERNAFIVSVKITRGAEGPPASARVESDASKIVIKDAWVQEMPASRKVTAAYMVIENNSTSEVTLLAARTERAQTVELHKVEVENNMMRMRKLERITIPAGSRVELTGDLHIMLIDLNAPIQQGDQVPITLEFSGSLRKSVLATVRKRDLAAR